ncbi:MAG: heparinase II/III family protein [Rikenellaceae bacterium]
MKKLFSLLVALAILMPQVANASDNDKRIRIYPSITKGELVEKMEQNQWAGEMLRQAHLQTDKYVDIHTTDKEWIVSRLQMYWKNHYTTPYYDGHYYTRAEGSAPEPTVRFTGSRDWATDHFTPALEDIKPYMDYNDDQMWLQSSVKDGKPWEWVDNGKSSMAIERINVNIMTKAMYSAFIYWLTGEDKYAEFSYDIFTKYITGLHYRENPVGEGDTRNEPTIGITSFEIIHEGVILPLTLCYDFLYDYIKEQEQSEGMEISFIHDMFQRYADRVIEQGLTHNNWNIIQGRYITYLALNLYDDAQYENGKGRQYYIDIALNQYVGRQRALTNMLINVDKESGMWNESPMYSVNSLKMLLEVFLIIDGLENKNILKDMPELEKGALSTLEYNMPNTYVTAFGDNAYSVIDCTIYEFLLAFYKKYDLTEKAKVIEAVISDRTKAGFYNRERGLGMDKLFNYVGSIDSEATSDESMQSARLYAVNANLSMMRNGVDKQDALMLISAGTGYSHSHWNGINMELYGKGYPLGIDKGPGTSYWQDNHNQYFKLAIAHNTVRVDGESSNTSDRMEIDVPSPQHSFQSGFPAANQKDADKAPVVSYIDSDFIERVTNSLQRRVNGIVRTSETSGYYIDIFRSAKREGGDKKHEYSYHNLGEKVTLFDMEDNALDLTASDDFTPTAESNQGYEYFNDKMEIEYEGDFKAIFELNFEDEEDIRMGAWVKGDEERKIFSLMTPAPSKGSHGMLPKKMDKMEIPTMIIRQSGEAWSRPFVALYEPYMAEGGSTIEAVEFLDVEQGDAVAIEVTSKCGAEQLIINNTDAEAVVTVGEVAFAGSYGVVSTKADGSLAYLFLGNGSTISCGDYAITAQAGAQVLVEWCDCGSLKVNSDCEFTLEMPRKSASTLTYISQCGEKQTVSGSVVKGANGKRMTFKIK